MPIRQDKEEVYEFCVVLLVREKALKYGDGALVVVNMTPKLPHPGTHLQDILVITSSELLEL